MTSYLFRGIGALLTLALLQETLTAQETQVCCKKGVPTPWKGYNKGVRWVPSLSEAQEKAGKSGKLIMLYQLVGDLDKEGC